MKRGEGCILILFSFLSSLFFWEGEGGRGMLVCSLLKDYCQNSSESIYPSSVSFYYKIDQQRDPFFFRENGQGDLGFSGVSVHLKTNLLNKKTNKQATKYGKNKWRKKVNRKKKNPAHVLRGSRSPAGSYICSDRPAFYAILYCVSMLRDMSLLAVTKLNILNCYSFLRNRLMKDNSQLNSVPILK